SVAPGWYIDEVLIETGELTYNNPEDWESGIDDWHANYGTWEIGEPTSGPGEAYEGSYCAGTILGGDYCDGISSRLISQSYTIHGSEQNPRLRFWHWYHFNYGDWGKVQVRVVGDTIWQTLEDGYYGYGSPGGYTSGGIWVQPYLLLSNFAGQEIEFSFWFYSEPGSVAPGWYIDLIHIEADDLGTIDGYVKNNGEVYIEDVYVRLEGTGINAMTNSSGYYCLSLIEPGTYDVSFAHPNYLDTILPGNEVELNDTTHVDDLVFQIVFETPVEYAVGDQPSSVFSALLNDDEEIDLAVANLVSNNVSILMGNSDGTFQEPRFYNVGSYPSSIFAAFINDDNDNDLIVTNSGSGSITILLNNGSGVFEIDTTYEIGVSPSSVFAANLDDTNGMDLIVTNTGSNNISILLNDGNGNFPSIENYDVGDEPSSVYASDFNNDNNIDLVVTNSISNNISVLLNDGDGTFQTAVHSAVYNGPISVFCEDLDNDAYNDIAVVYSEIDSISVFINDRTGSFPSPTGSYDSKGSGWDIFGADYDSSEFIDLVITNHLDNRVTVLFNNGEGGFEENVYYDLGIEPSSVISADFNNDNKFDLAVAITGTDSVSILINEYERIDNILETQIPHHSKILWNYPNPFNASTNISFNLEQKCDVNLNVYNLLGQKVITLVDQKLKAGHHNVNWNASEYSSGIYFYRLTINKEAFARKMTLLK
ncbi:MAG: T9SS type A sorting domain-containing protein, partial [bacterium]|nr:T9SS type A sorting domain-containing protein [bacterium]